MTAATYLRTVRCENMPAWKDKEPGVLYFSEKYELAIHLCACGCGLEAVTPTSNGGWTIAFDADDAVTLSPSLLQRMPCRSHYFVQSGKVVWT
jgi:hypothetical protein